MGQALWLSHKVASLLTTTVTTMMTISLRPISRILLDPALVLDRQLLQGTVQLRFSLMGLPAVAWTAATILLISSSLTSQLGVRRSPATQTVDVAKMPESPWQEQTLGPQGCPLPQAVTLVVRKTKNMATMNPSMKISTNSVTSFLRRVMDPQVLRITGNRTCTATGD